LSYEIGTFHTSNCWY